MSWFVEGVNRFVRWWKPVALFTTAMMLLTVVCLAFPALLDAVLWSQPEGLGERLVTDCIPVTFLLTGFGWSMWLTVKAIRGIGRREKVLVVSKHKKASLALAGVLSVVVAGIVCYFGATGFITEQQYDDWVARERQHSVGIGDYINLPNSRALIFTGVSDSRNTARFVELKDGHAITYDVAVTWSDDADFVVAGCVVKGATLQTSSSVFSYDSIEVRR